MPSQANEKRPTPYRFRLYRRQIGSYGLIEHCGRYTGFLESGHHTQVPCAALTNAPPACRRPTLSAKAPETCVHRGPAGKPARGHYHHVRIASPTARVSAPGWNDSSLTGAIVAGENHRWRGRGTYSIRVSKFLRLEEMRFGGTLAVHATDDNTVDGAPNHARCSVAR